MPLEVFVAEPVPAMYSGGVRRRLFDAPCEVPGCPRPQHLATDRICSSHRSQALGRFGEITPDTLESFLRQPDVRPLPPLGDCRVLACFRLAANPRGLCLSHQGRWKTASRAPGFDFARWCQTDDGVARSGLVNLRALTPLLQAQMMAAVQRIAESGRKVDPDLWRVVVRHLRQHQADNLHAGEGNDLPPQPTRLLRDLQREARRAATTWDEEQQADVWDLGVAGLVGRIDFTPVTQPWLRAGTKWWISEDLPRRRSTRTYHVLRGFVNSLAELSTSLRLHRPDDGNSPHLLGRSDILAFLTRLAHLRQTGTVTPACHVRTLREVKTILAACRDAGLTKPGGPMQGLPGEFAIRSADLPPDPDQHSWRPLPAEVIRALDAGLPRLEQRSQREFRTAVELLMDTGRRPNEICQLPLQCLDRDADGRDVLIYTDFKSNRLDRRLPIADSTAQLIRDQQQRVRERFPNATDKNLVLLPAKNRNSHGGKSINATTLSEVHRAWIDSLPPPTVLDGTAFPRQYLVLYAYRHSYAQRHADAGTPMDVLRDLMGHRSTATTQVYYRVSEQRSRAAVDKLAAYQYDGAGEHLARQVTQLLDSEHHRRSIGQVAVPFGVCAEPSNVKAGGGACPYRMRCVGCGHFRTDASYLPELRAYLDRLLADRERVLATSDLDDWARAEATPSDTEITKIRHLIRRVEADLTALTEDERAHIDAACAVVRKTRQQVVLGIPTVLAPTLDLRLPGRRP